MTDRVGIDLGRKAAEEAVDLVKRKWALADDPHQMLLIALYTASGVLGMVAGAIQAIKGCTHDEALAAVGELCDPRQLAAEIERRS